MGTSYLITEKLNSNNPKAERKTGWAGHMVLGGLGFGIFRMMLGSLHRKMVNNIRNMF